MEMRMYKFRLYPSVRQKEGLVVTLKACKIIYNELLEQSINTYKSEGITLKKFDYNKLIKGKYAMHSQVAQNVSDRVHKAFQNFFRRIKDKQCVEKGFPRFKSRVNSITFPQSGFKITSDKKLRLSKIGNVPAIMHRIPKGKIKTLTIKQNRAGQWFAVFSCELPDTNARHPLNTATGIDVGLENFVVLSNGECIANPRHIIKAENKLKLLQRRLSRKNRGSANRRKARFRLARWHVRVSNQRNDFLHKLSHKITRAYSFIAVEDLNIRKMVKNHYLAKNITDASWNSFVNMLSYKAVTCGGQLVKVNPRNTSRTCSRCREITEMPLSKRQFSCQNCGLSVHRDVNASINILKVGMDCAELNACGHSIRPESLAVVDESGTIFDNS